jgi:Zn ribbon nucleic-acid-binding protein
MIKLNRDKIIKEFNLIPYGAKGYLRSDDCPCPDCSFSEKFGILFLNDGGVVKCMRCGYATSLIKYLINEDKRELLEFDESISIHEQIPELKEDIDEEKEELPEVEMPRGFKRITHDDYLEGRNWEPWQYEQFEVGVTNHFLERKHHHQIVFTIRQKGRKVAYLCRSRLEYDWHKQNLKEFKEGEAYLKLRYDNSQNTDFSSILGGFDEITKNTHTVILVEGLFDKANIDRLMGLHLQEEIKCCFTFGDTLNDDQIDLLAEFKNTIELTILMYDYATISQMQEYSCKLHRLFEVKIAEITDEEIDPGNMTKGYLVKLLQNLKNFLYFYAGRINKKLID